VPFPVGPLPKIPRALGLGIPRLAKDARHGAPQGRIGCRLGQQIPPASLRSRVGMTKSGGGGKSALFRCGIRQAAVRYTWAAGTAGGGCPRMGCGGSSGAEARIDLRLYAALKRRSSTSLQAFVVALAAPQLVGGGCGNNRFGLPEARGGVYRLRCFSLPQRQ
jgi:hypothetical protein